MAMGWDDALILGAISAGTTAYASHQSNNANMGINAMNATQAADFFRDSQDYNTWMGREQRVYNSAEAAKAREYARETEATKWQRAVGDMQAAGINPMLSVSQGAGGGVPAASASGGGSAGGPSGQVPSMIPMRSVGGEAAQSAAQIVHAKKESDLLQSQKENIDADTAVKASQVPQNMQQTQKLERETQNLLEMKEQIKATVANLKESTFKTGIEAEVQGAYHDLIKEDIKYRAGQTDLTNLQKAKIKVETTLLKLSENQAKSESDFYGSEYGSEGHPWMQKGLEAAKGFRHLFGR